jgi:uncharacterized damage-inducible protein DinB
VKPTSGKANTSEQEFIEASCTFLEDDFLPRLLHCVDQFSEADLWWRPNEASNSVGNLILHLSGNIRQWVVEKLGGTPSNRNRDAEFAARGSLSKSELIANLESAVHDTVAVLREFKTDALLERGKIQAYDVSALHAIYHVVEHFSYHLGQIIYIYKLRTGVDPRFYEALSRK